MAGLKDKGKVARRPVALEEQLRGLPVLSQPADGYVDPNYEMVKRIFSGKPAFDANRKTAFKQTELDRELLHLPDPLKLAEHTLDLLRQDEHIKALAIVKHASRIMPCTVSWNHIIDYNMSKGRVSPAMKTYNDVGSPSEGYQTDVLAADNFLQMKKRAQPPDAYTYTILLRGLAANHQYPQSLPRALSVYRSMYAENSPVRPSIIHTNVVLKACSRANNIDALFEVAAKLPKRGMGAPDNVTFTTIINAVWNAVLHNPRLDAEQQTAKRQEAVRQMRRMWEDIVGRWRNGDILLDEDMVCAAARLLMVGDTEQDYDDVLSLFEQTMGIRRLVPPLGDPARPTHITLSKASTVRPAPDIPPKKAATETKPQSASQISDADAKTSPPPPPPSPPLPPSSSTLPPPTRSIFAALPLTPTSLPRSRAQPSQQTLSALIEACTHLRALKAGTTYWTLLTTAPHSIAPDAANLHAYLRLLRLARASRHALAVLTTMLQPRSVGGFALPPQPKSFRIVMSACVRDASNPAAPATAVAVLDAMAAHLETPDLRACEMFVELLEKTAKREAWAAVLAGLGALKPVIANLRSVLAYGTSSGTAEAEADEDEDDSAPHHPAPAADLRPGPNGHLTRASRRLVVLLLGRVVSVYDGLLEQARESLAPQRAREVLERRGRLAAYVERNVRGGLVAGKKVGGWYQLGRDGRRKRPRGEGVEWGEGGGGGWGGREGRREGGRGDGRGEDRRGEDRRGEDRRGEGGRRDGRGEEEREGGRERCACS
ncbi:hypothetical protein MMC26_000727 [Xylographa opegraphella]|nr:hypothetical protein [Xylographa opegraphella]